MQPDKTTIGHRLPPHNEESSKSQENKTSISSGPTN